MKKQLKIELINKDITANHNDLVGNNLVAMMRDMFTSELVSAEDSVAIFEGPEDEINKAKTFIDSNVFIAHNDFYHDGCLIAIDKGLLHYELKAEVI